MALSQQFKHTLQQGKTGESLIARWLNHRGYAVLPVYEIADGQYKGPAVYTDSGTIIAPDMLAFNKEKTIWFEAKYKEAFTFHRITKRFVTGIDVHHYENYLSLLEHVSWPIWLLFLHRGGSAKDSQQSPSGLYGGDISFLRDNENHRHDNWGKGGMVYWAENVLTKIASYEEIAVLPSNSDVAESQQLRIAA